MNDLSPQQEELIRLARAPVTDGEDAMMLRLWLKGRKMPTIASAQPLNEKVMLGASLESGAGGLGDAIR